MEGFLLKTEGRFGASAIGIMIVAFILEFFQFLKWYVSSRKRITSNCLVNLVEVNKDVKQRKKELKKIRLNVFERILIIVLQFLIKAITFLLACLIMQTYNMGYIILISIGLMIGNLIFGLVQDTIVIRKIKRENKKDFQRK